MASQFTLSARTPTIAVKGTGMEENAEATVVLKLNQGTVEGMACYHSFLEGLWLLSFHQGKESNNTVERTPLNKQRQHYNDYRSQASYVAGEDANNCR